MGTFNRLSEEEKDFIYKNKDTMNYIDIAKKLERHKSSIYSYLRRNNFTFLRNEYGVKSKKKSDTSRVETIAEVTERARKNGLTYGQQVLIDKRASEAYKR